MSTEAFLAFVSMVAICVALTVEACNRHADEMRDAWNRAEPAE